MLIVAAIGLEPHGTYDHSDVPALTFLVTVSVMALGYITILLQYTGNSHSHQCWYAF